MQRANARTAVATTLLLIMAIAPGGGLHIDSSEAQQWALEVRMQRDEPDELRSQVLHGVSLRVTFSEPAYCSSSRTVQRRLVEKEEDVLRSLRVYTRHGDALTFTPADVDVGESEYVLFVASPSPRRRVEGWLSLFSPSLASNASTLTVVLAHSDEHTAGSIGYELGTDLRVEFAGPTCEWVGADRSPLERREYTFAPATPAAISFNTIVQLADDEQEREEFQDSNAFGQGGEEQQEETPNLYKHMKAPKSDFDIPAPEPVEASIHSIYTEFIQAEKPGGGKASRLAYATEAGWHAGRKFRRQLDPTTAFVGIHEYLKGEEAVGVATGFLISGVVEGLSPNAFNQGTNKLQNLGDKHLVPLTIDNLCGSPDGVEGKEAGVSGTADGAGILSISTANDLIQMVPRMVEQIAIDFAALLSQELHASLTISVKEPLEDDLVRALGKTLGAAVPQTLSEIVPIAIKRILPGYILHALTNTLTHTLTRALTHSLTHTLQHTLTRTPAYERACYECQFFKRECHKCADGFDQRRQHIAGYYAEHYASYFSDYFSDYFTKGEGSLDADTSKILACYYGEGEASEAECGVYRVGEGGEGGRFTRTVE